MSGQERSKTTQGQPRAPKNVPSAPQGRKHATSVPRPTKSDPERAGQEWAKGAPLPSQSDPGLAPERLMILIGMFLTWMACMLATAPSHLTTANGNLI